MTRVGERQSQATVASWVLLAVGVAAASLSAIFTRYALGAGALTVSFWRCAGGSALLLPFAAGRLRNLTRAEARSCIVAGVFLGVHFAAWISSLYLTTVSSAVLLVSTTPIFVAVAARLMWADRLSKIGWCGICLATVGTVIVAGADLGGSSLTGNVLAVVGAAAGAGYALGGQVARRTVGVIEYSAVAYAVAAIVLAVGAAVTGTPFTGFDRVTWQAIAALTLVPQVLGHTLINITLKDLHATVVSVTIMAEPIIAIYLAYVLFDESPSLLTIPGGIAILAGIYLVSRAFPSDSVIPE
jgi:drug/metabolite transporter (DMT)-like permease